jgi:hypothetical protein
MQKSSVEFLYKLCMIDKILEKEQYFLTNFLLSMAINKFVISLIMNFRFRLELAPLLNRKQIRIRISSYITKTPLLCLNLILLCILIQRPEHKNEQAISNYILDNDNRRRPPNMLSKMKL